MTTFQLIVVAIALLLVIGSLLAAARAWISRREGAVWAATWLAIGAAVTWPELTAGAAKMLGIGRGADLVLYCSVIVMMIGFLMVYARLQSMRREITLLVRRLAIQNAVGDSEQGADK